ncbi:isocitrate/isopropylmalate dehydrogenase family protein [uncultured Paludibaculum sp.]|uniref:isocitrate/isopropylmalate dehydrogenase family protein n=1 Tax=uncultured Paludibaculum sp. TaxID=1765020 RepID=UPI002AAB49AA|nr:isocitrate/isopropylmalate dehydrogenase family protein [uncultured Paludibaculum sp.]
MKEHKIAWLPGDGIGPEVCDAARLVLDASGFRAEYIHGDIGWEFWRTEGDPLPPRTLDLLRSTDCAFFGAITSKPGPDALRELAPELHGHGFVYRSPIVRMRQMLDLYVCRRPCKAFRGNPLNYRNDIDIVVFRENTEGMYIGVEYPVVPDSFLNEPGMQRIPPDAAISIRSVTRHACRRIVEAAFECAVKHGRRRVTAVHKANVLRATCGVFLDEAQKIASQYPQVEFDTANVDAMCMWLVKNPQNFDIIVTTNLFGDILSDLCAQLIGGMGFAYSGNIGDRYAVFEPTHGSAPKYAGQNKVNPLATILAARDMVEWLGELDRAKAIESAVAAVIEQGQVRTYDMGGFATTSQMAQAVATRVSAFCHV